MRAEKGGERYKATYLCNPLDLNELQREEEEGGVQVGDASESEGRGNSCYYDYYYQQRQSNPCKNPIDPSFVLSCSRFESSTEQEGNLGRRRPSSRRLLSSPFVIFSSQSTTY